MPGAHLRSGTTSASKIPVSGSERRLVQGFSIRFAPPRHSIRNLVLMLKPAFIKARSTPCAFTLDTKFPTCWSVICRPGIVRFLLGWKKTLVRRDSRKCQPGGRKKYNSSFPFRIKQPPAGRGLHCLLKLYIGNSCLTLFH